uniref:Uncharacterized protein n=1 Tax=Globisporangium ultimum (strain ATCC 200006 / CBS 805.95 / DAOM BR144) TaxID=431595 RepID=K3WRU9_GLOUD
MITTGNAKGYDALGRAVLWSSQGQQVMMQWEQQYMHTCVDALRIRRSDRVLEIGFGLAYSATHIQRFRPLLHTIIECDAAVIQDAETFARSHEGVRVKRGTWQSLLPMLSESDQFDCVFFDDYPLPELEELGITQNQTRSLRTRSRWHDFLDAVLPHVAVGGRITGYLARDIDLQRVGCRVETSAVDVKVSDTCEYFPHKTALVPVITVLDRRAAMTPGQDMQGDGDKPAFPHQESSKLLQAESRHRTDG